MAIVIGLYNRKGGVGKSSAAINLAAELALKKKKALIIDGDSQINLTQFFFEEDENVFENGEIKKDVKTLYDVLEGEDIEKAIRKLEFTGTKKMGNRFKKNVCALDVIPGSHDMDYYAAEDMGVLRKKLLEIKEYDYIFIDFPPAHNTVTMTYLVASDYIVSPLHLAKNTSTYGYKEVIERCREARKDYGNTELKILGSFYINTQLYKADQKVLYEVSMEKQTKEALRLFEANIKCDYSSMQRSESEGKPLCICCRNSEVAKNYKKLAVEMEKRIRTDRGGK